MELKYKSKMLNGFTVVGALSTPRTVVVAAVDFTDDLDDRSWDLAVVNGSIVNSISGVVSIDFEVIVIGSYEVLGGCVIAGLGRISFSSELKHPSM